MNPNEQPRLMFKTHARERMVFYPSQVDPDIIDLYAPEDVTELLEEHKTGPVLVLDVEPATLVVLCLKVISSNIDKKWVLDMVPQIPFWDVDLFYTLMPTTLPLKVTVPIIDNEIYWKRCCETRWPERTWRYKERRWKQLYCERHMELELEQNFPGTIDYQQLEDLCRLLSPYICRLRISCLRGGIIESDDICNDCVDLGTVPRRLDLRRVIPLMPQLRKLHLSFGFENAYLDSPLRQAHLEHGDIERIGQVLTLTPCLTKFIISSSHLTGEDMNCLYGYIVGSDVCVLEIIGCELRDTGAQVASLIFKNLERLVKFSLEDNDIGPKGCGYISYILTQYVCKNLMVLNLSRNPLGDEAGAVVASILLFQTRLEKLNMAATGLKDRAGVAFGKAIKHNKTLKELDLSCNKFGDATAFAIFNGLEYNNTLNVLDVRACGFHFDTLKDIKAVLFESRNSRRTKMVSKVPKRVDMVDEALEFLRQPRKMDDGKPIKDYVPQFGDHGQTSLTTSWHGQLTLSTIPSTKTDHTPKSNDPFYLYSPKSSKYNSDTSGSSCSDSASHEDDDK